MLWRTTCSRQLPSWSQGTPSCSMPGPPSGRRAGATQQALIRCMLMPSAQILTTFTPFRCLITCAPPMSVSICLWLILTDLLLTTDAVMCWLSGQAMG